MPRPVSEILSDALASFEDGKRWTQDAWFRGLNQITGDADKFCSLGAVGRSMVKAGDIPAATVGRYGLDSTIGAIIRDEQFDRCIKTLVRSGSRSSVANINDNSPFEVVKEMFCKGIKRALREEEDANREVD